ncbi:S49 family peptidase [Burkholderia plantarii]|uniref:S49 family peptidase n=1 Tax=Burkholderia plantarii TaxID=41899 RepID=UPI0007069C87|nr:S49 family peptidase [Burkholderia plantarii]ALK31396.1 ClpP class periplasmic serine protease [Burkholderia plantarii]GLZ22646.1 hypothetical protein Bpla01_61750 [Burkholderia plantarii]
MLKALHVPTYQVLAIRPERLTAYTAQRSQQAANDSPLDFRYTVTAGVAILPIAGELAQRTTDTMLGYDLIAAEFYRALADSSAHAIALVIDSPGGDVAGLFDLVDAIYTARTVKPLLAICSESACSAAYAIASACEQVTVPRTGIVGSVGVITGHVDESVKLDKAGVKVTLITAGDRKADGNQVQPLSNEARTRLQADVDAMGRLFVATVARNRGMSADVVGSTQASTFMGSRAVDVGFADAVMAPDDAFLALAGQLQAA